MPHFVNDKEDICDHFFLILLNSFIFSSELGTLKNPLSANVHLDESNAEALAGKPH